MIQRHGDVIFPKRSTRTEQGGLMMKRMMISAAMSDPKKLSTEELLVEIERLAVLWLGTRHPEFRKMWQQCEDERKARERSIWNWFRK
jgi:hypothetical protein